MVFLSSFVKGARTSVKIRDIGLTHAVSREHRDGSSPREHRDE